MSKATYPLKLPTSIKAAAARLAREGGVSLSLGSGGSAPIAMSPKIHRPP